MKFTTYDYLGRAKARYIVEELTLPQEAVSARPVASHHIIVGDASGSMTWDLDAVKSMIEKLLTLHEYLDANMLVSLLTYSGEGDLVSHFERVSVGEIMKPGSRYVEEIRKIRTRGLTCISQGLRGAQKLVRQGEVTCVTLHSDGYANDQSPGAERRIIDTVVEEFRKLPDVFVNTIAYRPSSDFKLLAFIANACSGTCFQTPTAKEVFDALYQTTNILAGQVAPALELQIGNNDYQAFASNTSRKLLGSGVNAIVRGVSAEDDRKVYRYRRVEEEPYNQDPSPVCGEGTPLDAVFAFARTQLAEGNLNAVKYALMASRDTTLIQKHIRALTGDEIAALALDLESALFDGTTGHSFTDSYRLPNVNDASVLAILGTLAEFVSDIEVDIEDLTKDYRRRGVQRIAGVRKEDGTVEKPWLKTAYKATATWTKVSSFDLNRNNATVNMLVTRPINLVTADDQLVGEVAGVRLDNLKSFNNYTIVGDGFLNVAKLTVRIGNKRLFRELVEQEVLTDAPFDPKATYQIVLAGRPLVAYDTTFDPQDLDGVFNRLARAKVLSSILAACLKDKSDAYTEEQVVELRKHYLSTSLFVNLPTTTPYADLKTALTEGSIDTRVSYKVDVGSTDILNLGELYSANKFLERTYNVSVGGVPEKKPNFMMRWDPKGITYGHKVPSARTKLGPVDDLMKPIFEDFLKLSDTGAIEQILRDSELVADSLATKGLGPDAVVEALADTRRDLDQYIETTFREVVAPLVFFIGSTGLVPDEFNAKAMTAEQVKAKFPNLSIGKNEADGMFFLVGTTLLSVYATSEYYSTGKDVSVAAA